MNRSGGRGRGIKISMNLGWLVRVAVMWFFVPLMPFSGGESTADLFCEGYGYAVDLLGRHNLPETLHSPYRLIADKQHPRKHVTTKSNTYESSQAAERTIPTTQEVGETTPNEAPRFLRGTLGVFNPERTQHGSLRVTASFKITTASEKAILFNQLVRMGPIACSF